MFRFIFNKISEGIDKDDTSNHSIIEILNTEAKAFAILRSPLNSLNLGGGGCKPPRPSILIQDQDIDKIESHLLQASENIEPFDEEGPDTRLNRLVTTACKILLVSSNLSRWPRILEMISLTLIENDVVGIEDSIIFLIEEALSHQKQYYDPWISSIYSADRKIIMQDIPKSECDSATRICRQIISKLESSIIITTSMLNILGLILAIVDVELREKIAMTLHTTFTTDFYCSFQRQHILFLLADSENASTIQRNQAYLDFAKIACESQSVNLEAFVNVPSLLKPIRFEFGNKLYFEDSKSMVVLLNYSVKQPELLSTMLHDLFLLPPSFLQTLLCIVTLPLLDSQLPKLGEWILVGDTTGDQGLKYAALTKLVEFKSSFFGLLVLDVIGKQGINDGRLLLTLQSNGDILSQSLKRIQSHDSCWSSLDTFVASSVPSLAVVSAIKDSLILDYILKCLLTKSDSKWELLLVKFLQFSSTLADHFGFNLCGFEQIAKAGFLHTLWKISFPGKEIIHPAVIASIFKFCDKSFQSKAIDHIISITNFDNVWNLNSCKLGNLTYFLLESLPTLVHEKDDIVSFLSTLLRFHCQFDRSLISRHLKRNLKSNELPDLHDEILQCLICAVNEDINWPQSCFVLRDRSTGFHFEPFPKLQSYSEFTFYGSFYLLDSPIERTLFQLSYPESNDFFRLGIKGDSVFAESSTDRFLLAKNALKLFMWQNIILVSSASIFSDNIYTLYCNGSVLFNGKIDCSILKKAGPSLNFVVAESFTPTQQSFNGLVQSAALYLYAISPDTINLLSQTPTASTHFKVVQILPIAQQPIVFVCPKSNCNISFSVGAPTLDISLLPPIISRIPLKTSFQALGGFEVLFPLLTQLEVEQQSTELQQKRSALVIRLFLAFLKNSEYHLKSFINSKGPRLLSLHLQKKPDCLSAELLSVFLEMKELDSVLANAIDNHIIFEPQIWSRSSKEIREAYFKTIANHQVLITTRSLTFWMDRVELYFGNCEHAWWFLDVYLAKSDNFSNREESRLAESLFCCTDELYTATLTNTFAALLYKQPNFFYSVLEAAGPNIILSLLCSPQESARLASFNVIQNIEYFSGDSMSKSAASVKEIPASVFASVIKGRSQTVATYLKLLSLCFSDYLKTETYRSSLKTLGKFKSLKWLNVLLECVFLFDDFALRKVAVFDLSICIVSCPENTVLIGKAVKLELLAADLNTSNDPDYTKRVLYLISCYVLSSPSNSPRLLRDVVLEILSFEKGSVAKCSAFFEVILGRLGTVERLPVLELFEVIDEVFFYHKDMSLALHDEFDGMPLKEIIDMGVVGKIRRASNAPALLYQKCYPYEEFSVSTIYYSNSLQKLLAASGAKGGFFGGNLYREKCIVLSIRLLISSLSIFDPSVWTQTLNHLGSMFEAGCFRESGATAMYVLGALYEAFNLDASGRLLILPNMLSALDACAKSLIEENLVSRSTLDSACANLRNLSAFLDSPAFKNIYDTSLYPMMRAIENEWIGKAAFISKRLISEAQTLISTRSKRNAEENIVVSTTLLQVTSLVKGLLEERNKRFLLQSLEYEKEKQEVSKLWVSLSQEVSFERRVWTAMEGDAEEQQMYYKLFPVETSARLRLRHMRNINGQSHSEASSKRDKLPLVQSLMPAGASPLGLPDRRKILSNKLQSIQIESVSLQEEVEETKSSSVFFYGTQTEICIISIECELVCLMMTVPGKVEVTNKYLRFYPSFNAHQKVADTPGTTFSLHDLRVFAEHKRPIASLSKLFLRKYKMRNSALESFFVEGDAFLFNFFGTSKEADTSRRRILRVLQGLQHLFSQPITETVFSKTNYTQQWIQGGISNFQYLMACNTYSGRTFNDLTQYPVFPLILIDYHSAILNLNDPRVYRDLSKSIGSLNESRLRGFVERYDALKDDPSQFPFMFGTHYSSSSSVLFYLLRVEPFTSLHIQMQGGKFDHADRQFYSLQALYQSITTNSGDVKELIPEFFYFPDMFRNSNSFDLGVTQSGEKVENVILPPWAKTPEEFVKLHQEALESSYVSKNLHLWIDLIWGFKQKGHEAIRANNVFHYLTYDGAVDVDMIEDVNERRAVEDQMNYFGQTPIQLFDKPHPARIIISPETQQQTLSFVVNQVGIEMDGDTPCSLFVSKTGLLLVGQKLQKSLLFKLENFQDTKSAAVPLIVKPHSHIRKRNDFPFYSVPSLSHPQMMASTPNHETIFVAGQFDDSIHSYNIEGGATLCFSDRIYDHLARVTCCCTTKCGRFLVTGGEDHLVRLWSLQLSGIHSTVVRGPKKVFYGHEGEVTQLIADSEFGVIVSLSSFDKSIMIHSMFHSIGPISICPPMQELLWVSQSPVNGDVFAFGRNDNSNHTCIHSFNINGKSLQSRVLDGAFCNLGLATVTVSTSDFSNVLVLVSQQPAVNIFILSASDINQEIARFSLADSVPSPSSNPPPNPKILCIREYPSLTRGCYIFVLLTDVKQIYFVKFR